MAEPNLIMPSKEKFNPKDYEGKDYKPPLSKNFQPSGIFSFEFRERLNPFFVTEITLLLPPESSQISYGYRLTVHKTIGGTTFDFMGTDNPEISISGSLWSPWIDILPDPFGSGVAMQTLRGGTLADIAALASKAVQSFFPLNQMSGLDEFFRIKYMLFDFFSKDAKFAMPVSLDAYGPLPGLHFMVYWTIVGKNNLRDIQLIYRDYDDDVHWEVVPRNLEVKRDKNDPYTVNWSISLIGIKDLRLLPLFVISLSKKVNADAYVKSLIPKLKGLNPFSIANSDPATMPHTKKNKALQKLQKEEDKTSETTPLKENVVNENVEEDSYDDTLDQFYNDQKDNLKTVIYQSVVYHDIALEAANNEIIYICEDAGVDPEDYETVSESPDPDDFIVEMNLGGFFHEIGQYELETMILAGAESYMGNRNSVSRSGSTGKSLLDLPDITEETFSVGKVEYNAIKYVQANWSTYIVKKDDNLGKIAVRQLGDYTRFPEIAKLNNLKMSDFLLEGMVGEKIKLPERGETIFNNPNNLVYYFNPQTAQINNSLEQEILGTDIPLDEIRDFVVDNSGDFAVLTPINTFVDNVTDILSYPIGTLPLYPDWGLTFDIGKLNNMNEKVIFQKIRNAAKYDPRVKNVNVYPEEILVEGDKISFKISVSPIIGENKVIKV